MKKVLILGAFVLGAFAFTSCNKTYVCEYDNSLLPTIEYSSKDYSKTQLDAAESACELGGGKWSTK